MTRSALIAIAVIAALWVPRPSGADPGTPAVPGGHPGTPPLRGGFLTPSMPSDEPAHVPTEITLRRTVRVPPGAPVTLADISDLSGPAAASLSTLVLVDKPPATGWASITLAAVRDRIRTDHPGTNWGLLSLRGSTCFVSQASAAGGSAARQDRTAATVPEPADTSLEHIRGHITARIAQTLAADPHDLRLAWDPRDRGFLDTPAAGLVIEVRATATSDRLPVRVTIFEGERLAASRSIAVGVEVRRTVAIAAGHKSRGEIITDADVKIESRWLGPSIAIIPPDRAPGLAVKSRLEPGSIITAADVQSPVAVKRGDLVVVNCLSGHLVVRTRARARASAREGELVLLETLDADRRERRTFTARVSGPGQAVIVTTEDQTKEYPS